jgi:phosphoglucosamine mutase
MARLFGTDGVRGLANRDITPNLAMWLGEAAARVLARNTAGESAASDGEASGESAAVGESAASGGEAARSKNALSPKKGRKIGRSRAIIGRDSRVSGEFLTQAVSAGLLSAGVDVIDIGVLPTPGIAYLSSTLNVDLGVVISASHNPMQDNGIKFFTHKGFKLDDALEDEISDMLGKDWDRPTGKYVGRFTMDHKSAAEAYVEHLTASVGVQEGEKKSLEGLTIAVDAANGAAHFVAPKALRNAGAEVIVINASPDGYNINDDSGSTHPEQLQAITKASDADMGVAFDGDADRCIAVDETGELVDGDKIIAIIASDMKKRGLLTDDTVVVTVMSNKGFLKAMESEGVKCEITTVGDRYVLERMLEKGYILGGEQSGHIINLRHATTGDGTLSALMLADVVARSGKPLSELARLVQTLPQALVNVSGVNKEGTDDEVLQGEISRIEELLAGDGRVLLRPSGTEPLVRVMVEAKTQQDADLYANFLANVMRKRLAI